MANSARFLLFSHHNLSLNQTTIVCTKIGFQIPLGYYGRSVERPSVAFENRCITVLSKVTIVVKSRL